MALRARRPRAARERPVGDSTPGYLRARFVIGAVALATLLGFLMFRVAPVRSTERAEQTAGERPVLDVEGEMSPRSTNPDDCPAPGAAVSFDAAELLAVLQAAVADPAIGEIPASEEVLEQISATAPSPPLNRMTRVRGFAGGADAFSTCVMSYWTGSEGPMQSLDVVTVAVTESADRSSSRGSRERWEVTRWLRGTPQPEARSRVTPLSFSNGSGCSRPDREVSVAIPEGSPDERLRSALEELISGPAGRSPTVSSSVPLDLQVLEATVDGSTARVALTPTADDNMTRCEGTAAYQQVVSTAEAIVAESIPPAQAGSPPAIDVEVVIEGEPVDTLRR